MAQEKQCPGDELKCGEVIRLQSTSCEHCTEGWILARVRLKKKRCRFQLLMPFLQVVTFVNLGYLHVRLSLITLFERCLRLRRRFSTLRALSARLRVMN